MIELTDGTVAILVMVGLISVVTLLVMALRVLIKHLEK